MALVLTLKEEQDFFVGNERFVVDAVNGENDFVLRNAQGKTFSISDRKSTEVLPGVMISAGSTAPTAHVAIEAPQEIKVLRGDKYRRPLSNPRYERVR